MRDIRTRRFDKERRATVKTDVADSHRARVRSVRADILATAPSPEAARTLDSLLRELLQHQIVAVQMDACGDLLASLYTEERQLPRHERFRWDGEDARELQREINR